MELSLIWGKRRRVDVMAEKKSSYQKGLEVNSIFSCKTRSNSGGRNAIWQVS